MTEAAAHDIVFVTERTGAYLCVGLAESGTRTLTIRSQIVLPDDLRELAGYFNELADTIAREHPPTP